MSVGLTNRQAVRLLTEAGVQPPAIDEPSGNPYWPIKGGLYLWLHVEGDDPRWELSIEDDPEPLPDGPTEGAQDAS